MRKVPNKQYSHAWIWDHYLRLETSLVFLQKLIVCKIRNLHSFLTKKKNQQQPENSVQRTVLWFWNISQK